MSEDLILYTSEDRKQYDARQADKEDMLLLDELEKELKRKKK